MRLKFLKGTIFALLAVVLPALSHAASPVRCYPGSPSPVGTIQSGTSKFFTCLNQAGTPSFSSDGRVPTGYVFVVTDIVVTPDAGTDKTALTDVTLYDAYGDNSRAYSFRLRNINGATYSEHFETPYLILKAGHRIEGTNAWFAEAWAQVHVSGILLSTAEFSSYFAAR